MRVQGVLMKEPVLQRAPRKKINYKWVEGKVKGKKEKKERIHIVLESKCCGCYLLNCNTVRYRRREFVMFIRKTWPENLIDIQ